MVRTLDFHSKNVGSNPASLTIATQSLSFLKKSVLITGQKNLKFKYDFVSLFAPLASSKITVNSFLSVTTKKILIKQSYLIAA